MNQSQSYQNVVERILRELKDNYTNQPFYAESDLVDWVFKKLKKDVEESNSNDKVYMEYPYKRTVPSKLDKKLFKDNKKIIKSFYREFSDHYELSLNDISSVNNIGELVNGIKGVEGVEDKYSDIAILANYLNEINKSDKDIEPMVIIEFKFEPSKTRIPDDFRNDYSKGNHNSPGSIFRDVIYLCLFTKSHRGSTGYFVLADEDGKQEGAVQSIFTFLGAGELKDQFKKGSLINNVLVLKFNDGIGRVL